MKILLIHNNYGVYSGEEAVVDRQIALFEDLNHEVSVYRKTTENKRGTLIGNIKGLLQGFYSFSSVKDIKRIMKNNRPDVVVIHNLYPYISPAILKPIKKASVPIIMTIHNYRLMCPTGLFVRNTQPCELCIKGNDWNCVKYNCEHSLIKSIGYAGRNWYARRTKAYLNHVDIYACITKFQGKKLIESGYPKEKMCVIPNFVDKESQPEFKIGNYVAISGRMSKEKGIDMILEVAQKTPEIEYLFAGTNRPEDNLMQNLPSNCRFVGHLSGTELADFYENARFLVIASRWYEGFPMTVLDASMYGKPTIGPAHGGFLEIIDYYETGLLFSPGNVAELQEKIVELWNNPQRCLSFGKQAYLKMKEHYTVNAIKQKWQNLLEKTVI